MPEFGVRQQPESAFMVTATTSEILRLAMILSDATRPILLLGEKGIGKSVIANEIHCRSNRNREPWIEINCAALRSDLIMNEIFGHEKGAYTSADATKEGLFEIAGEGTIFLDEIGNLSKSAQGELLFVLEGRPFRRMGGNRIIRSRARVIAATNHDLEDDVHKGLFMGDLYDRLSAFPMEIPPIRRRPAEIIPLIRFFFGRSSLNAQRNLQLVEDDAGREVLESYAWPGNIREVEHRVDQALLCSVANTVTFSMIAERCAKHPTLPRDVESHIDVMLSDSDPNSPPSPDDVMRAYYLWLLRAYDGNVKKLAQKIGMARTTLIYRLKLLNIKSRL